MPNGEIITYIKSDETVEKKEIIEIAESDVSGYRLLSQSAGVNLHHSQILPPARLRINENTRVSRLSCGRAQLLEEG